MPTLVPTLVRVTFKCEDFINGVAVGPVHRYFSDGVREVKGWMTQPQAKRRAKTWGVTLEEV